MANKEHKMQPKRRYESPSLTVLGSVRNLTGGSIGPLGDTMTSFMQRML